MDLSERGGNAEVAKRLTVFTYKNANSDLNIVQLRK